MNKITKTQIGSLTYFIVRAYFIGITFNNLINISKQDSYISIILGFILGFIPLLFIYYIFNYEPSLSLPEKNKKLFGNILGTIINIFLILFTFLIVLFIFGNLVTFIFSQYLNKTPTLVISIVFIVAIIYVLSHGISNICKTAVILLFFSVILYIISISGLIGKISINNLKPFIEFGYMPIIKASYSYIAYNVLPLYLLLIIPKDNIKDKHFFKSIIIFYIIASFILISILLATMGIFGLKLSYLYEYPEFQVLKYVSFIGLSARIEGILIIQWIFDLLIFIIIGLYFIIENINSIFKINKVLLSIILATILVILNELITSNIIINNLSTKILHNIIFIFISLFLIVMCITIKIKKNKKTSNDINS